MIGTTLSHFKITAKLGEGGMGEVYRAEDTKLGREVAIKVLPEAVANDPERLARFEREAKVLASLNHPHIAAIYSFESAQPTDSKVGEGLAPSQGEDPLSPQAPTPPSPSIHFLVMELAPGEDLKVLIERGPVPVDQALLMSLQIAEALEAAHERGIVHRDLKPGNIKIGTDGSVKVLDFGLAKALEDEVAPGADLADSPTLTAAATQAGIILGTAAYMSPEQATGTTADRRSDIWSFGVVLAEMLTGRTQFEGQTVSHVLASVLKDEPDLAGLSAKVPPRIFELIERCLRKEPTRRLQAVGDARILLQDYLADPEAFAAPEAFGSAGEAVESGSVSKAMRILPWSVAALAVLTALGLAVVGFRQGPVEGLLAHADITVPKGTKLLSTGIAAGPVVVSPDGTTLAWVGVDETGTSTLWTRRLDEPDAHQVPGTEGAKRPFWSPDSRSLGFFARQTLNKISILGGSPVALASVADPRGGSWGPDGTILFVPNFVGPIMSVPEGGGEPRAVTRLDESRNEQTHRYPYFLPDGRSFLYLARTTSGGSGVEPAIKVGDLDSTEGEVLVSAASNPVYASGYLLYARQSNLMAHGFDPQTREMVGDPVPITDHVLNDSGFSRAIFSASQTGVLAFEPGGSTQLLSDLLWMDRDGRVTETIGDPALFSTLSLSPDEKTAAVIISEASGGDDIWLIDLDRSLRTRFTFSDPSRAQDVSNLDWSPDGRQIAYGTNPNGSYDIFVKSVSGTGEPQLVWSEKEDLWVYHWTPDGEWIAFTRSLEGSEDAFAVAVDGEPDQPITLLDGAYNEWPIRFSPNMRWFAYCSDESGRREIYVRSFPDLESRWQVSTAGGDHPTWRGDGRAIFFLSPAGMLVETPIEEVQDGLSIGKEQALFAARSMGGGDYSYAPSRNGDRFLLLRSRDESTASRLSLILNWTELVPDS